MNIITFQLLKLIKALTARLKEITTSFHSPKLMVVRINPRFPKKKPAKKSFSIQQEILLIAVFLLPMLYLLFTVF